MTASHSGSAKYLALIAIISMMPVACTSVPPPIVEYDTTQDFSAYQTFTWGVDEKVRTSGDMDISPNILVKIETALQNELARKGYRFVDTKGDADFAVVASVGTREAFDIERYPELVRVDPVWGQGIYVDNFRADEYTEGSLSVDVFDLKKAAPVWHGVGQRRLTTRELGGREEDIDRSVAMILSSFPPDE